MAAPPRDWCTLSCARAADARGEGRLCSATAVEGQRESLVLFFRLVSVAVCVCVWGGGGGGGGGLARNSRSAVCEDIKVGSHARARVRIV